MPNGLTCKSSLLVTKTSGASLQQQQLAPPHRCCCHNANSACIWSQSKFVKPLLLDEAFMCAAVSDCRPCLPQAWSPQRPWQQCLLRAGALFSRVTGPAPRHRRSLSKRKSCAASCLLKCWGLQVDTPNGSPLQCSDLRHGC